MLFNSRVCLQPRQYRQNALVEVYFIWRFFIHFLIKRKIIFLHEFSDSVTHKIQCAAIKRISFLFCSAAKLFAQFAHYTAPKIALNGGIEFVFFFGQIEGQSGGHIICLKIVQKLVGKLGFEPRTNALKGRYSTFELFARKSFRNWLPSEGSNLIQLVNSQPAQPCAFLGILQKIAFVNWLRLRESNSACKLMRLARPPGLANRSR